MHNEQNIQIDPAATDISREVVERRYLAMCAERGLSPYGANRAARRRFDAIRRGIPGRERAQRKLRADAVAKAFRETMTPTYWRQMRLLQRP